jgi:L-iditol 2-dehydrogenase
MSRKMIGLVKTAAGEGNMELRELPIPEPGAGQVQVEVKATGICGSDLHIYHSDIALAMQPPVVTGHEFSGVVTRIGEGVNHAAVGDRVSAITSFSTCGRCINCKTGKTNICSDKKLIGYWYDGAFANYIVVPEINIQKIPDNVSFHEGAALEPFCCAVEAVIELTRVKPEDLVLVSGPGVIGQLTAQLAQLCGGRVVLAGTSRDQKRLAQADKLGVHHTVNLETTDLTKMIMDMTDGAGADVFFECSGAPAAARSGLQLLRRGGQYTQVGLFGKPIEINFEMIAYKEARVTGSLGQNWLNWNLAVKLLANKRIQLAPFISDVLPLDKWKEGFEKFEKGSGLKILLEPVSGN